MRISTALAAVVTIAVAAMCGSLQQDTCALTVRLVDAETGRPLPGLLKITDDGGEVVIPGKLLSRGMGMEPGLPINEWSVLTESGEIPLPRKKLTIAALSGLERERGEIAVDLTGRDNADVEIRLRRFFNGEEHGYKTANTHLHLMKVSRDECNRYLREIPRVDHLDIVFLSYLERAVADFEYTSNHYTDDDLAKLTKASGVLFGNGEEHRHNFAGFGQGFGHVMLLNIKKLIQPVSIGPGIMLAGTDGIPLQRGIDTARRDGATIIWCHDQWGLEDTPNWLLGKVDAHNIFDGGTHGSYRDSFYKYLNAGVRVPFSTGTDWFMYDFSRVYAVVDGPLTVESWLKALASGRTFITNGPLLSLSVDGKSIGETVRLPKAGSVTVAAKAVGRVDFVQVELVRNGDVIATAKTRPVDGHFEAVIETSLPMAGPGWIALRTPSPSVPKDPDFQQKTPLNELGRELFSHTSAVFVEVGGKRIFDRPTAEELLAHMQSSYEFIDEKGTFADEQERQRVLDVYRDGIAEMQRRLAIESTKD